MRPLRAFRTSLYLSLAIAILAIGVAGGDLLPEIPYLTGFSLVVLAGAFIIDGRWQLSLRHANVVGIGLAGLLGLWAIFQVVRPPTGIAETLPWPASALPYLAPVLMILIPAKMLRPKHVGDYWAMYGLSLLAMALACAMAMDGMFILIFVVYAVVFVWSLVNFQLYRELGPQSADRLLSVSRWKAVRPATPLGRFDRRRRHSTVLGHPAVGRRMGTRAEYARTCHDRIERRTAGHEQDWHRRREFRVGL